MKLSENGQFENAAIAGSGRAAPGPSDREEDDFSIGCGRRYLEESGTFIPAVYEHFRNGADTRCGCTAICTTEWTNGSGRRAWCAIRGGTAGWRDMSSTRRSWWRCETRSIGEGRRQFPCGGGKPRFALLAPAPRSATSYTIRLRTAADVLLRRCIRAHLAVRPPAAALS